MFTSAKLNSLAPPSPIICQQTTANSSNVIKKIQSLGSTSKLAFRASSAFTIPCLLQPLPNNTGTSMRERKNSYRKLVTVRKKILTVEKMPSLFWGKIKTTDESTFESFLFIFSSFRVSCFSFFVSLKDFFSQRRPFFILQTFKRKLGKVLHLSAKQQTCVFLVS